MYGMVRRDGLRPPTDASTRAKKKDLYTPDMPGEVLAPAKDHATVAIASALEGLCGGGAVAGALGDVGVAGGGVGGLLGDEGGHVVCTCARVIAVVDGGDGTVDAAVEDVVHYVDVERKLGGTERGR